LYIQKRKILLRRCLWVCTCTSLWLSIRSQQSYAKQILHVHC